MSFGLRSLWGVGEEEEESALLGGGEGGNNKVSPENSFEENIWSGLK